MKKAIVFSVAVCLFSWLMFVVVRFGFGWTAGTHKVAFTVFETIYMLFPLLTAVVLQRVDKRPFNHTGLVRFKLSWAWLVAWLLPMAMVLACVGVNLLMPGVRYEFGVEQLISQFNIPEDQQELVRTQFASMSPALLVGGQLLSALLAGVSINALFAFGEEYGWRNYLVDALRGMKFWKAALFIGFVWGIWHFPLIMSGHNYPNEPYWGVLLMVVFCILMGAIELYFVLKTKSVIVAAIIHGTINASAGLTIYFIRGGNDFLNGLTGLSGFITMTVAILIMGAYDRYVSKDNIFSNTLGESLCLGEGGGDAMTEADASNHNNG